ncbi:Hsp20/alpha crystallin family protein [Patescibacteria group bacterium]|nr:Hsp20/alpha crystallin family protein [Patescibacteria group bacterium]MBU4162268.1 Hsp20/alpha crystallin family protein [Patescibacteria group bacterium]
MFKKSKSEQPEKEEKQPQEQWLSQNNEGELAIDAYETDKEIVIQSTIAGISASDLDISAEEDMLIIKGSRQKPESDGIKNYFQQECYWGPFSKKIILPEKAKIASAKAEVKNGVLTLKIPKAQTISKKKITIKDK